MYLIVYNYITCFLLLKPRGTSTADWLIDSKAILGSNEENGRTDIS